MNKDYAIMKKYELKNWTKGIKCKHIIMLLQIQLLNQTAEFKKLGLKSDNVSATVKLYGEAWEFCSIVIYSLTVLLFRVKEKQTFLARI